ncbi:hypothetical protein AOQ84DRAFT_220784 [Glonium stellatum]|uniref:Rhodopsin domain-containing protein n=1 Tax=Glonium stellatum TaxID=574774 RepID=A0A8E2F3C0_9PEZI|nr:hypothetical protein AOQ84DRAFT_220784 [Glonium stellatum]
MVANASALAMPDLSKIPAVPPPPGVMFDPNNPDNYKSANIIMHSIILSIMTIAVVIRLYTRTVIKKSVGVDDCLAVLSWWLTISQWSYLPAILSIKLCILLGYNRIFQIDRMTKRLIWFAIFALTVFYIICFFCDLFYCTPVQRAWNRALPGHCISYAALPWATGIFNIISDFYILIIPMPLILGLTMKLARKIRIVSIFSLGLFTCIASIMRFVVTQQSVTNPDQTYVAAKLLYWAVLEINLGIICSCATVFPAFFDASAPKSLGSLVSKLLSSRSASQANITPTESKRSYDDDEERGRGLRFLSKPSQVGLDASA